MKSLKMAPKDFIFSLLIYTLIQITQWLSYTAIFKILLSGKNQAFLAPLFIAFLALFRGIASVELGRRKLVEKENVYTNILILGILLTVFQVLLANSNLLLFFLILTGFKLGLLTLFQIWRDVLSNKMSLEGLKDANRINSIFSVIDFGTMAIGVLVGGFLTSWFGPVLMLWSDAVLLVISYLCLLYKGKAILPKIIDREKLAQNDLTCRPLGILGHALRSVSDAGFQGLLPIVAYQVLKMSPVSFGIIVSLSGLFIAIGSKSAVLLPNLSQMKRRKYASFCFFATLGNAVALWYCFMSDTSIWFSAWLSIASLLSGFALVILRTIVISRFSSHLNKKKFDVSLYFNAIRWFGIGIGALLLAWAFTVFSLHFLVTVFLIVMSVSGLLIWLEAFEIEKQPYNIGQKVQKLILGTIVLLTVFICMVSYFIFLSNPQKQRIESRNLSLLPYIHLVEINMKISDFSEVMRLTRNYKYPQGTAKVSILGKNGRVIFLETFFKSAGLIREENTTKKIHYNAHNVTIFDTGLFARVCRYEYLLLGVGPSGDDIRVEVFIDDSKFILDDINRFLMAVLFSFIFLSVIYLSLRSMIFQLLKPLNDVSDHLQDLVKQHSISKEFRSIPEIISGRSLEIQKVVEGYNALLNKLKESFKHIAKIQTDQKVSKVASQVAHDIRSPLTALNVVTQHLKDLPEDQRLLIRSAVQRIEDIANDLAGKRSQGEKDAEDQGSAKIQLLSSLIEPLISEKRVQLRSKRGLSIESDLSADSYGLFAKIQPIQFKRVLSNLINNSVEALGENGLVKVSLTSDDGDVKITVSDNGNGIPQDVLPKLMQKGASFGKENSKESGSGLGLYHAKESVESWDGKIEIQSEVGKGTHVTVRLPKASSPDWFVPVIEVTDEMRIVVLDDDNSIHQVWQGRFDSLNFDKNRIFHFTSPQVIISWYRENKNEKASYLFLCDYELLGNKENGLDVIEQLGIGNSSILVTSRFEEEDVKKGCERLGVKLLPKNLAGFVPIKLIKQKKEVQPDYILIDDNKMNHANWKLTAKIYHKKVVTFYSADEFYAKINKFDKATKIYIDSDLGENIKGEEIAKDIYDKGFNEIYLCTGYPANDFPEMPWIKEIVGKMPPFLNGDYQI